MASTIFAFSKSVKDNRVERHDITELGDVAAIDAVVGQLESLPNVSVQPLDTLRLRSNPRSWVIRLICERSDLEPIDEHANHLLTDFTEAMQTRMREEHKYALLLVMGERVLLCHSTYGERTITPEWKTIPRMLDSDNVLRFALFRVLGSTVQVTSWEREASSSFVDWLGPPKRSGFLFGGRFRVRFEIDGVIGEMQLTEEEMEAWVERHPEFIQGTVALKNSVRELPLRGIRSGRQYYDDRDLGEFLQDYESEKRGVSRYALEYDRLQKDALPLLTPYYDERSRVVRVEEGQEVEVVNKDTPGWDIVFTCNRIDIRHSYLSDIATRLVNGDEVCVFHAGEPFGAPAIRIGGLHLYNRLELDGVTSALQGYRGQLNVEDSNLALLLLIAELECLGRSLKTRPIEKFLALLASELQSRIKWARKWMSLEGSVVEYKSADFLAGHNAEVAGRVSEDLRRKLHDSSLKVYLFGVEDDGSVRHVAGQHFPSDRLEHIRKELAKTVPYARVHIFPVCSDGESLLVLVAFGNATA
ncbi:MAG: hypothetical protein JW846_01485 [Dehalococcoidia bacterium]|nr:hypothetical protein [Dehalococcoidia bacterium]